MSDPTHTGTPDTHIAAAGDSPDAHGTSDAHGGSAAHGTSDAHGGSAAHGDHGAGHGAAPLGPIDWKAWLAGIVGVAAGLLVVAALALRPVG